MEVFFGSRKVQAEEWEGHCVGAAVVHIFVVLASANGEALLKPEVTWWINCKTT